MIFENKKNGVMFLQINSSYVFTVQSLVYFHIILALGKWRVLFEIVF